MSETVDVAIVGAGIGGSALAVTLAKGGLSVLLLEKSLEHKDVVRGEWLAPWGVEEANQLMGRVLRRTIFVRARSKVLQGRSHRTTLLVRQ